MTLPEMPDNTHTPARAHTPCEDGCGASTTERKLLKCGVCFREGENYYYAKVCKIYQHRELAERQERETLGNYMKYFGSPTS